MDCSASKPSDCTQLIFQFYRICFNHLLNDGRGAFARNVTTWFGLTRTFHNMTMLAIARKLMATAEPASEIWVPVQQTWFFGEANCTNKTIVFVFIHWIEPETKTLEVGAGAKNVDAWSWNRIPKIELRLHRPWLTLVPMQMTTPYLVCEFCNKQFGIQCDLIIISPLSAPTSWQRLLGNKCSFRLARR